MKVRLLAVDLDGTLVDSAPDLAHCVDQALASVGRAPPGFEAVRSWIGDGVETLLKRALTQDGGDIDEPTFAAALAAFSTCYRDNLFVRSRLYAGVAETLADLDRAGMRLACVTNKRVAFAARLLEQAGIRERFAFLYGGDSLAEKKPSPLPLMVAAGAAAVGPADAAMVGDSHHDYHAAAAAGFAFYWASYGYCPRIEPRPDAPIVELCAFADLRALL